VSSFYLSLSHSDLCKTNKTESYYKQTLLSDLKKKLEGCLKFASFIYWSKSSICSPFTVGLDRSIPQGRFHPAKIFFSYVIDGFNFEKGEESLRNLKFVHLNKLFSEVESHSLWDLELAVFLKDW